jgi:hypothetical protein
MYKTVLAQDIKSLDYVALYKKSKIKSFTIDQVRYQHQKAVDTSIVGIGQINEQGLLTTYKEYNGANKWSCTHYYSYDVKGKINTSEIEFAEQPGQKYLCTLEYHPNGKLKSRSIAPEGIHFWFKESYEYNKAGVMIKSTQHYHNNGNAVEQVTSYPEIISPKENSLNYIYDQRGLLILRQFYNAQSVVFKAHIYRYQ